MNKEVKKIEEFVFSLKPLIVKDKSIKIYSNND